MAENQLVLGGLPRRHAVERRVAQWRRTLRLVALRLADRIRAGGDAKATYTDFRNHAWYAVDNPGGIRMLYILDRVDAA